MIGLVIGFVRLVRLESRRSAIPLRRELVMRLRERTWSGGETLPVELEDTLTGRRQRDRELGRRRDVLTTLEAADPLPQVFPRDPNRGIEAEASDDVLVARTTHPVGTPLFLTGGAIVAEEWGLVSWPADENRASLLVDGNRAVVELPHTVTTDDELVWDHPMIGRPRVHRTFGDDVDPDTLSGFIPGALASGMPTSVGLLIGDTVREVASDPGPRRRIRHAASSSPTRRAARRVPHAAPKTGREPGRFMGSLLSYHSPWSRP